MTPEKNPPGKNLSGPALDQIRQVVAEIDQLQEKISQDSAKPSSLRIIGLMIMGSEQKEVMTDSKVTLQDWTMEEIMAERNKLQRDAERQTRFDLATDLGLTLESLDEVASQLSPPFNARARVVRDFTFALLEKVITSNVELCGEYVSFPQEEHYTASLLEAIRRLILRPTYSIISGQEDYLMVTGYDEESFWDEVDKQLRRLEKNKQITKGMDSEEIFIVQQRLAHQSVDKLSLLKWQSLVNQISRMVISYLEERGNRSSNRFADTTSFFARVFQDGKPLIEEEVAQKSIDNVTGYVHQIMSAMKGSLGLESVLDEVSKVLGKQITLEELLNLI